MSKRIIKKYVENISFKHQVISVPLFGIRKNTDGGYPESERDE